MTSEYRPTDLGILNCFPSPVAPLDRDQLIQNLYWGAEFVTVMETKAAHSAPSVTANGCHCDFYPECSWEQPVHGWGSFAERAGSRPEQTTCPCGLAADPDTAGSSHAPVKKWTFQVQLTQSLLAFFACTFRSPHPADTCSPTKQCS